MTPKFPMPWPPLNTQAKRSRVVLWRDRLLTVLAWLALGYLARDVGRFALDEVRELLGYDRGAPPADLAVMWNRVAPYLVVVVILAEWLALWALTTLHRERRAQTRPQPAALTLAEAAARAGTTEQELQMWRSLQLAVAHVDAREHLVVEYPTPTPESVRRKPAVAVH